MPERIEQKEEVPSYPKTKGFLEDFQRQFQEQLGLVKKPEDIRQLQENRRQVETILHALDAGDVGPARKKIASMVEANLRHLEIPTETVPEKEESIANIRDLTNYLAELANVGFASEVSKEGREITGHALGEKVESRTIGDKKELELKKYLEAAEQQLEKTLSEIREQKNGLRESQKQARLTKLRTEISKQ